MSSSCPLGEVFIRENPGVKSSGPWGPAVHIFQQLADAGKGGSPVFRLLGRWV